MKILLLIASSLIATSIHAQSTGWYEVPMETVRDFENIPKKKLDEVWNMRGIPEYQTWTSKNLQRAKDLGWRPRTQTPDGTCWACHPILPETYERLRRK